MENTHIIDLHFLNSSQTIASFLIRTEAGPVLIETGPESTFDQLENGIIRLGYQLKDIRHVFLTHIHFDHAGAAWKLAEQGAEIYLHPIGLPHMAAPEKLWNSAAQIYGDDMERLWGKMCPIPEEQLIAVEDKETFGFGDTVIEALHTPGHAVHHIAWKIGGNIFTGDVAGVKINNNPVVPPCPPPDIHLENWKTSIQILKNRNPKNLYLTHFGVVSNVESHLHELEDVLDDWANWIKPYFDRNVDVKEIIPQFMQYTRDQLQKKGASSADIQLYEHANPSWMSVTGLMRYWKLKDQGRI